MQVTVNYWLLQHGMSIGIGDTVADQVTMNTINEIIEKVCVYVCVCVCVCVTKLKCAYLTGIGAFGFTDLSVHFWLPGFTVVTRHCAKWYVRTLLSETASLLCLCQCTVSVFCLNQARACLRAYVRVGACGRVFAGGMEPTFAM